MFSRKYLLLCRQLPCQALEGIAFAHNISATVTLVKIGHSCFAFSSLTSKSRGGIWSCSKRPCHHIFSQFDISVFLAQMKDVVEYNLWVRRYCHLVTAFSTPLRVVDCVWTWVIHLCLQFNTASALSCKIDSLPLEEKFQNHHPPTFCTYSHKGDPWWVPLDIWRAANARH